MRESNGVDSANGTTECERGRQARSLSHETREPDLIVPCELAGLLDGLQDLLPSVAASVRENELPELVEAVRRSNFLHGKPWFSVEWLLKRSRE